MNTYELRTWNGKEIVTTRYEVKPYGILDRKREFVSLATGQRIVMAVKVEFIAKGRIEVRGYMAGERQYCTQWNLNNSKVHRGSLSGFIQSEDVAAQMAFAGMEHFLPH